MKKVLTIAGTRPELIRLSEIIKKFDIYTHHIFVHTWQNYTPHLHDQFFEDLSLRKPDYQLNTENNYSGIQFIWYCLEEIERILIKEKPDVCLILWDTNSALSAYACKKLSIPVFHMEAWNRCYSDEVPEEMNRKIIDSLSTYLLPYTQRSRENLLSEWYHPSKIIVTGNPISEIIDLYARWIKKETSDYILVTLHRTENITIKENLVWIINALNEISKKHRILLSIHPKLADMLAKFDIKLHENITGSKPYGFKEFVQMEQNAYCVLTDSWTVPEECAILKTPCVLMRNSTERPELLENNSMILSWIDTENILDSFNIITNLKIWDIPRDYEDKNISEKILKLILRHI